MNEETARELIGMIRELIIELQLSRAPTLLKVSRNPEGHCWECGASPRYQHKRSCRAGTLRLVTDADGFEAGRK